MKKILPFLLFVFVFSNVLSKDIIVLKNGEKIKGELLHVKAKELTFISKKKNSEPMTFTAAEVEYVKVDSYEKLLELQEDFYLQGITDATLHHGRFFGNFCAGFFGGAIGFVIVAVTDARAPNPAIVGQENYQNLLYREGYNKKAKGKNMRAAGIGWGLGALVGLIIIFSTIE